MTILTNQKTKTNENTQTKKKTMIMTKTITMTMINTIAIAKTRPNKTSDKLFAEIHDLSKKVHEILLLIHDTLSDMTNHNTKTKTNTVIMTT